MAYYQVEFQPGFSRSVEGKLFRTEEKAKKYARKVLGIDSESSLETQATIHPVVPARTRLQ
jgi:hypothetical protein